MLDNGFARKLMINFLLAVAVSSDLRHGPFGKLRLYLFTAIKKALYRAVLVRLFVEAFKNGLDRPQDNMQRNAALLPAFDQRPVKRTEQQMLSATADKGVFDLGEVIKVIQDLI